MISVLLYFGRAVDSTILVGLSSMAAAQSKPTANTLSLVKWLLDYAATNPDTILTYEKSNMVLAVLCNASYLSKPSAQSWLGGHFFCSSNIEDPPDPDAILNISKILKAIMSSAAKAELGALYINAQEAIPMQPLLEEMGHKHCPHPSKMTTAQHTGWSPTTSNHDAPRQST